MSYVCGMGHEETGGNWGPPFCPVGQKGASLDCQDESSAPYACGSSRVMRNTLMVSTSGQQNVAVPAGWPGISPP